MSNPTLAYDTPARTHNIRLGWLAIGAAVLTLQPIFRLLWRFAIRPLIETSAATGPPRPAWMFAVDMTPSLVTGMLFVPGVCAWCLVSRRRPGQPRGGKKTMAACLTLVILSQAASLLTELLTSVGLYRIEHGGNLAAIYGLLKLGSIIGWISDALALPLLVIGILFLLHVGSKTPSRAIAAVGAGGLALATLVFLCLFGLSSIYQIIYLTGRGSRAFFDFYEKAMGPLSITQSVIKLLFLPTLAVLALTARKKQ